jgi:hypothetical protein
MTTREPLRFLIRNSTSVLLVLSVFAAPVVGSPPSRAAKIVKTVTWTDKNGENTAVLTRREQPDATHLRVEHTAVAGAKRRTLRQVNDKVEFPSDEDGCDLTAEFVASATGLSDLDGDGIKELSFAYRLACRTDMSPSELKLLVLENGDKYILRGTSRMDVGPPEGIVGGAFKADPARASWPPGFYAHAEKLWRTIAREN